MGELEQRLATAVSSKLQNAIEGAVLAYVNSFEAYLPKTIKALRGASVEFTILLDYLDSILSTMESLNSLSIFEEIIRGLLEIVDEAERLRLEGKFAYHENNDIIKEILMERRATLLAMKGYFLRLRGNNQESADMFARAAAVARGVKTKVTDIQARVESRRVKSYMDSSNLGEFEQQLATAVSSNDQDVIEVAMLKYIMHFKNYLPNAIEALQGASVNISAFIDHLDSIVSAMESLNAFSKFEEIIRGLLAILEEAERLQKAGKLAYHETHDEDATMIKEELLERQATLLAMKGYFYRRRGYDQASTELFDRAATLAREVKTKVSDILVRVESRRAKAYMDSSNMREAIRCYEEVYVLKQSNCSPDDRMLQDITKHIVYCYRRLGEHESADHCAEVLAENLETFYEGKHRAEVGMALLYLSEGAFIRAQKEDNPEKKRAIWDEREGYARRAVLHFKFHDDPDPHPHKGYSKVDALDLHIRAIQILINQFVIITCRYDVVDLPDLINEFIEVAQKRLNADSKLLKPSTCAFASPADNFISAYTVVFYYFMHRQRFGPPLNEEEEQVLKKRKSEIKTYLGSRLLFDAWYASLGPEFDKIVQQYDTETIWEKFTPFNPDNYSN
jgi:tetratricopeptide (TPR) repeat protein